MVEMLDHQVPWQTPTKIHGPGWQSRTASSYPCSRPNLRPGVLLDFFDFDTPFHTAHTIADYTVIFATLIVVMIGEGGVLYSNGGVKVVRG